MNHQLGFDFSIPTHVPIAAVGIEPSVRARRPRRKAPAPAPRIAEPRLPLPQPTQPTTLAEVVARLKGLPGVAETRRRDLISAVNSFARYQHLATEALPTDIPGIRRRLEAINPAQLRLSDKRFSNMKADLVGALKLAGIDVVGAHLRTPLTAQWLRLRKLVPTKYQRMHLARFMRWCSKEGIEPEKVETAVLDRFIEAMRETALEFEEAKLRRLTGTAWNRCVKEVDGWPRIELEVASGRIPWTMSWDQFPASFEADVEACLARLSGADLLDEDGPVRPLRPVTVKFRRNQLKLAASAAVLAGVDAAAITCLQELLHPDRFKLILRHLLDRYGKPTAFIYGLATGLKSIARHHCRVDDDDLDRLRDLCRRVRVKQKGMGEKNRTRLRPFLDPDTRDRLLLLPQKLMAEAVRQPVSRKAALQAQLAVALEIGQTAPMRAANLAALEVGKTIHFFGEGRRESAIISLPEEMVKNEIALEYPLTPESTRVIKTYLGKFRPHLGSSSAFLFPGREGRSKGPTALGEQVSAAIWKHVGHRVHIHLLRHFAAMIYLQAYPGSFEAVRRLLGHATASAALDVYIGLEAHTTVRLFDETVLKLRRQAQALGGTGPQRKRR